LIRGKIQRRQFKVVKARYQTVLELLNTEVAYVDYLQAVVDYYIKPLSVLDWVSAQEISQIFGNLETVCASNTKLLSLFKNKIDNWNVDSTIGDVLLEGISLLSPHIDYVKNYSDSKVVLAACLKKSENFRKLLDIVRFMPASQNKTLNDLLIMPVQRVPRYRLILADLQKRTPANHPDFPFLAKSHDAISDLATTINETNRRATMLDDWKKEKDNLAGLEIPNVADRGLLDKIPNAMVLRANRPGVKEEAYYVLLTTDYLILCKSQKKRMSLSTIKGAGNFKVIETVALAGATCKPAESATMQHVLDISGHLIEIGDPEKLARWTKVITSQQKK